MKVCGPRVYLAPNILMGPQARVSVVGGAPWGGMLWYPGELWTSAHFQTSGLWQGPNSHLFEAPCHQHIKEGMRILEGTHRK